MTTPITRETVKVMDKGFLGAEYLTWLYFQILQDLVFNIPGWIDPVRLAVGKKATLKPITASGPRVSVTGSLEENAELFQAVMSGAHLDSLAIELAVGSRIYSFSLSSDGSLSGVKLPDLFTQPEETAATEGEEQKGRPKLPLEDVLALRMQCLDEVEAVIDNLYALFIKKRLSPTWGGDVEEIRTTISDGLRARIESVGVAAP